MSIFKTLVFKTNGIDLSEERTMKAFVIKVFHLYKRRNEWVNWDGETNLVNRTWSLFDMSLQKSTDSAERQRTQGTRFIIDEVPAICIIGKRYSLIATELFTESPLRNCEILKKNELFTLRDVECKLKFGRWFVSAIYEGDQKNLSPVSKEEKFFVRTSHSTGAKSFLAWSLKPRKINLSRLIDCADRIGNA